MLSGRCRRGGWRRPTGNSLRVGKPLPSATPPVPPTHATGHSAFSKRCPFLQSRNGRFNAFRGVACRHVTTIDFQTRSTKINAFESIDGSKKLSTKQFKLDPLSFSFAHPPSPYSTLRPDYTLPRPVCRDQLAVRPTPSFVVPNPSSPASAPDG